VPDFASEAVQNWHRPKPDPPDVLRAMVSGPASGVELTGWSTSHYNAAQAEVVLNNRQ
jgi:hypothetical protein